MSERSQSSRDTGSSIGPTVPGTRADLELARLAMRDSELANNARLDRARWATHEASGMWWWTIPRRGVSGQRGQHLMFQAIRSISNRMLVRGMRRIMRFRQLVTRRFAESSMAADRRSSESGADAALADTSTSRMTVVSILGGSREVDLWSHLESCLSQGRGSFRHVVVVPSEADPKVAGLLDKYRELNPEVVFLSATDGDGLSGGLSRALRRYPTDCLMVVSGADFLIPGAVDRCVELLLRHPEIQVLLSHDSMKMEDGQNSKVVRQPTWSPERLRGNPELITFVALRRTLLEQSGGLTNEFPGAEIYDLMLRVLENHPRLTSCASLFVEPTSSKPRAVQLKASDQTAMAVAAHFGRLGLTTKVSRKINSEFLEHTRSPRHQHKLSVIIPTAGQRLGSGQPNDYAISRLIKSVLSRPIAMGLEVVAVSQPDADEGWIAEARSLLGDGLEIIQDAQTGFNFARKSNLGALHSTGDLLLFLNDDIEVLSTNWLANLAAVAEEEDVGGAGALLLYDNGLIQHAGHIYEGGSPKHALYRKPLSVLQGLDLEVDREVSGVTGACLMQRREVWEQVGGFSLEFPNNFNDVDYCLKITDLGYRMVLCPSVRLRHHESLTRISTVSPDEVTKLNSRWLHRLMRDPYVRSEDLEYLE